MALSQKRLKEFLHYDPDTGEFTRRKTTHPKSRWRAGDKAGGRDGAGYVVIGVDKHRDRGHRLAWLYIYGEWPAGQIDHINGDRADNRIANLRIVTPSQNSANSKRPSHNTSGVKGVTWFKPISKWMAHVTVNQKMVCVGYFETLEEAAIARRKAAEELLGSEYIRHD